MPRLDRMDRLRDAFYTPDVLAQKVLTAATIRPSSVMDPAVGDGSLLRAAMSTWPDVRVYGLDIDLGQIARTRTRYPDWTLEQVDMFSERSRAASATWKSTGANIDLVVLNPPFSYRGGQSKRVSYDGSDYALTPASTFVAQSMTRLAPSGEVLAVLPAGILSLERDADFWSAVATHRTVETVAEFSSTAFKGTRTRSVLIAIRPSISPRPAAVVDLPLRAHSCVELVRGRVPVHSLAKFSPITESAPFLHTRDLAGLADRVPPLPQAASSLATVGPFVTLPRVGRVRGEHIRLVRTPKSLVLSDCVFALRTENIASLEVIQTVLLEGLLELQREYVGGCAPYLTIRRLKHFLAQRGYCCHHVPASGSSALARTSSCESDMSQVHERLGI
ncbi:N-6 DNA methylase [Nocardioides alkalitolerans]|uniref:N-6 DNA methylase n=1 Tax=Nocardioides alkalitolerans TaxID=281714 RepID=UPI000A074DEB